MVFLTWLLTCRKWILWTHRVRLYFSGNRLCQGSEGTLVVTGLNANVQKLISISRLDGVLTITPTAQEAVDIVMMDELMRELAQEEQADEESVLDETLEED